MKVISFSLWGDNKVYTYGMIENVLLARELYPGWQVRVHYNRTVPTNIITWLGQQKNVKLIEHTKSQDGRDSNMFWRFEDLFTNWTVLIRDSDSRLNKREKSLVDEWLASDKDFHIVRDHKDHKVPIIGGCHGARNGICKPFMLQFMDYYTQMFNYESATSKENYNADQIFLGRLIYPQIVERAFIHASHNGWEDHAKKIEWPETGYCVEIILETPNASKIMGDPETCFDRERFFS